MAVYNFSAGPAVLPKKVMENKRHNQKREQGREQAPKHTEISSFLFFLEIALDKLGKEKSVFLAFRSQRPKFFFCHCFLRDYSRSHLLMCNRKIF